MLCPDGAQQLFDHAPTRKTEDPQKGRTGGEEADSPAHHNDARGNFGGDIPVKYLSPKPLRWRGWGGVLT